METLEGLESLEESSRMCMEFSFCCWCSKLYYTREEEQKKMRCACAASHFCLGYGSLTTALSAGACDVSKSSVCLGFGITGVVLGVSVCLCLGWDKYGCPCDESSEIPSDDPLVLSQPT